MSTQWFVEREGTKEGPITSAQLRRLAESGYIQPETLVWREGLPDWVEARRIPGLFNPERGQGDAGSDDAAGGERQPPSDAKGSKGRGETSAGLGTSSPAAGATRFNRASPPRSIADRILFVAFAIGRWFSIVVVVVAVFVIGAGAFAFVASLVPTPPAEEPELSTPSAVVFFAECAGRRSQLPRSGGLPPSRAAAQGGGLGRSPRPSSSDPCAPYRVQARDVFAYLKMDNSNGGLEDSLCEVVMGLDEDDRAWFLDAFLEFAKAWSRSSEARLPGCEAAKAADWFVVEANAMLAQRERLYQQRLLERMQAEERRLERRLLALQMLGGGLASLLAFLALPLLIQIERNTRATA